MASKRECEARSSQREGLACRPRHASEARPPFHAPPSALHSLAYCTVTRRLVPPAACARRRAWQPRAMPAAAASRVPAAPPRSHRARVACLASSSASPASPPASFVRLQNVSYAPAGAGSPLLRGVDLALPPRGLALLVGRSGCGKTTLLTLLAGLAEPTGGTASVGGDDAAAGRHTPAAARLQRAGLVFQFPERHFLASTEADELTFGWPRGPTAAPLRAQLAARAQAALAAAGLGGLPLRSQLRALSGGTQRRLALALQLARAPPLLLLDEPLAGLDPGARRALLPLLRAAAANGLVLAVTHDTAELAPLATAGAFRMLPGGQLQPAPDLTPA